MMISYRMKRDGRTFDHETLEAIRLMAVERVRKVNRPRKLCGRVQSPTIYKWLKAALRPVSQGVAFDEGDGTPAQPFSGTSARCFDGSMGAIRGSMAWTSVCGPERWSRN